MADDVELRGVWEDLQGRYHDRDGRWMWDSDNPAAGWVPHPAPPVPPPGHSSALVGPPQNAGAAAEVSFLDDLAGGDPDDVDAGQPGGGAGGAHRAGGRCSTGGERDRARSSR